KSFVLFGRFVSVLRSGTMFPNLGSLREGADCCSRQKWKPKLLALEKSPLSVGRSAPEVFFLKGCERSTDFGIGRGFRGRPVDHSSGVGLECRLIIGRQGNDFREFLRSETQPSLDTRRQFLFGLKVVRNMQQRAGRRDDYPLRTELLRSFVQRGRSSGEVCQPDVSSFNTTDAKNLFWFQGSERRVELFWRANDIDVKASRSKRNGCFEVVTNRVEISSQHELYWNGFQFRVDPPIGISDACLQIGYEHRLVDLDPLNTFRCERFKDPGVCSGQSGQQRHGIETIDTFAKQEASVVQSALVWFRFQAHELHEFQRAAWLYRSEMKFLQTIRERDSGSWYRTTSSSPLLFVRGCSAPSRNIVPALQSLCRSARAWLPQVRGHREPDRKERSRWRE